MTQTNKLKLSISDGNSKLGGIPSVSFPPIKTCAPDAPCARPDHTGKIPCYIVKNVFSAPWGKTVARAYERNLKVYNHSPALYFSQISDFLSRKRPQYFRFHVSGDFISRDHLVKSLALALEFPETRFLAFSKRYSFFPPAADLPNNFALVASLWPNYGQRPAGYPVAFYQRAGAETRAPDNALQCHNSCENCFACWNLRALSRDVIFNHH